MDLILWRHAEAEDGGDDSARALTKRGRKQAGRMAQWLRPRLEGDWLVLASPARRAVETVKALDRPFEIRPALDTAGTARHVLREARWPEGTRSVIVVGHQPTLGEVAAQLLGGAEAGVAVRKGAIWWFARRGRDGGETILRAVLDPDVLG